MQPQWDTLQHAYGSAKDVPALLAEARADLRPGHVAGSTWFRLWSALCHQGDVYSASYAAVPYLVELARMPEYSGRYDPILLAASIELARLDGRGPAMPPELNDGYRTALADGHRIANQNARLGLDQEAAKAYSASAAAFAGDARSAKAILDEDGL